MVVLAVVTGLTRVLFTSGRRSTATLDHDLRLLRSNCSAPISMFVPASSLTRK